MISRSISTDWPGLPNDIDTAVTWPDNGMTYFFKGSEYWKFHNKESQVRAHLFQVIKDPKAKTWTLYDSGGGLVVSELAFHFDEPSLNADV